MFWGFPYKQMTYTPFAVLVISPSSTQNATCIEHSITVLPLGAQLHELVAVLSCALRIHNPKITRAQCSGTTNFLKILTLRRILILLNFAK